MTRPTRYDIVVIRSGPAGQKAAIQIVNFGKRMVLTDGERNIGGTCLQHGKIPSKALGHIAMDVTARDVSEEIGAFRMREGSRRS